MEEPVSSLIARDHMTIVTVMTAALGTATMISVSTFRSLLECA